MIKKQRYIKPAIVVIAGVQTGLLAGSIGTDPSKMAGQKDHTTGKGTNPKSSSTDANGNIYGGSIAGSDFSAKGWVPVGTNVLDSL